MARYDDSPEARTAADDGGSGSTLWTQVGDAGSRADVALVGSVPAVLLLAFFLPRSVKWRLALDYANPTLVTAFTSHFVHFSARHVLVNLLGGTIVVATGYLLSVLSGRRQQFLVAFACFVFAFPFVLSGLNLLFVRPTVGVGFSGVVLAFVGYLGVALMDFVGEQYDAAVGGLRSAWLFFLALALIAFDLPVYGPLLSLAALVASVALLRDLVAPLDCERFRRGGSAVDGSGELIALGLLAFLVYPTVSVPTDPTTPNGVVNVYSHVLGFCLGYIATYVMVVLDGFD